MLSQDAWPREVLASAQTSDHADAHAPAAAQTHTRQKPCGADDAGRDIFVSRMQTATSQTKRGPEERKNPIWAKKRVKDARKEDKIPARRGSRCRNTREAVTCDEKGDIVIIP